MKINTAWLLLLSLPLMLCIVSCQSNSEAGDRVSETEAPADTIIHLSVRDTIGVELGSPNYVFGQIVEADICPNGDVVVLDASTMNLRRFDKDGSFIKSAGRQGTGPGEFQMPRGMTVLKDGDILVSDMAGGAVCVFDDSLKWIRNITGFFPRPPFTIRPAGDSSFVGMLPAFDREEGQMGYSIARMDMDAQPAVVYREEMRPFDPSRIGPLGDEYEPLFTSEDSGRVFVSAPGYDAIDVKGYLPDGEQYMSISQNVDKVEKTQEELAQEEEDFQDFTSRMGGRGRFSGADISFNPIPYRRAVTDLGVDGMNRLWVRIGTYSYPFWRVYDSDGGYLFSASLQFDDPDINGMTVRITGNGMVAWVPDPTTWPKVYLLNDLDEDLPN